MAKKIKKSALELAALVAEDVKNIKAYMSKVDSCKTRGIEFLLTFNEFKALRRKTKCYYTGVVLEKVQGNKANSFTLDRKDSYQGYTADNTVACSNEVNDFKSQFEKRLPLLNKIIKKIPKIK